MPEDGIYEDLTLVRRRASAVFSAVAVLVFLVLSYYWKIQILEHGKYRCAGRGQPDPDAASWPRRAVSSSTGTRSSWPTTQAAFKVSIIRENVKDPDASFAAVSRLLGLDEPTLRARVDLHKDLPALRAHRRRRRPERRATSPPSRAAGSSSPSSWSSRSRSGTIRSATVAAHVLGYLQERTPEEIRARPDRRARAGRDGRQDRRRTEHTTTPSAAWTAPSTRSSTASAGCAARRPASSRCRDATSS